MDSRYLNIRNLIRFFSGVDTTSKVIEHNDLFCLLLSQLVYFSGKFIIKRLQDIGVDDVTIIDYDGPRAFVITFNSRIYVSIKGLSGRNREEWPIILNFVGKKFAGIKAHAGFVNVAKKLHPHVRKCINERNYPITFTGHSMGGAIATMLGMITDECRVVTFGSPKTVTKDLPLGIREFIHYRISADFVTHLPPFIYERPGKHVTWKKPFNPLKLFENHKLISYSEFIQPMLNSVYMAQAIDTSNNTLTQIA